MQLAELNIGRLTAPLDDPRIAEFVNNLDRINGMAERMPGFVWRLVGDGGNATGFRWSDDPQVIVNISVWESVAALETFVFRTAHAQFYKRRAEWFGLMDQPHFALWWVPDGHRPDLAEAKARLDDLHANGPSDRVFGWSEVVDVERWRRERCA
jgi:Domain of unknown function (DUF3291)